MSYHGIQIRPEDSGEWLRVSRDEHHPVKQAGYLV